jgi:aminoglycoside phosphotransferase (APT) family kinase protein
MRGRGVRTRRGGNISAIYEIRCAEPDQPIILKVYPDAFHWKMAKEVYVYSLIDPAEGLPTPSILGSDDSRALLPQPYVLMTTLKGQPLSHVASSLSAPQLRAIYFQMGALLARVHGITLDAFGYITTRVLAAHAPDERGLHACPVPEEVGGIRGARGRCSTSLHGRGVCRNAS